MKKCSLRLAFVILLVSVAILPAYCGWGAFKKSSPDLSVGTSTSETTEKSEATTTEPLTTSSSEAPTVESQTEELLEKSTESSKNYDEALEATKVAVEAVAEAVEEVPEKVDAIAELAEKVEDLKVSKAVLDEDQELLASIVEKQAKELERAERKLEGINWGVGVTLGYKPLLTFSPGIAFQARVKNWIFRTDITYDIDTMGSREEILSPMNLGVRIGVMYEF